MPNDDWTRTEPNGELVRYTYEFGPGAGGVITKTKGIITETIPIGAPMTREEVEAAFRNA